MLFGQLKNPGIIPVVGKNDVHQDAMTISFGDEFKKPTLVTSIQASLHHALGEIPTCNLSYLIFLY